MDMNYTQIHYLSDNELITLTEILNPQTIQPTNSLKWFYELQSEDSHMLLILTNDNVNIHLLIYSKIILSMNIPRHITYSPI